MERMPKFLDVSTPAKRFRLVAIWEAITWAALLVAMFFKWVLGHEEAVKIPGMVHGVAAFIPFVIIALLTARSLKWNLTTTFWALVSSVPPFGSIVFEVWAVRTGRLGELSAPGTVAASQDPALSRA
jgi:integral membrane protein